VNADEDGHISSEPFCPRCGYDLSGARAAWKDSCPLHGICAECGLDFRWRDVLHPLHTVPSWFFEHAGARRARAFLATLLRSLAPWSLWRQIQLHFGIRTTRLLLVAVAALFLSHVVVSASSFQMVHRLTKLSGSTNLYGFAPLLPPGLPDPVYAAAYLAWPYATFGNFGGAAAGDSPWIVLAVGCFLMTPAAFLLLPFTLRRCRVRGAHLFRVAAYSLAGLPLLVLVAGVLQLFTPPWQWVRGFSADRVVVALFGYFGALPLMSLGWLMIFWWFAATRYLRIPHAAAVVATMLAVAFLFSAVTVAFLHPGFRDNPATQLLFW
jgi:hypothetical protein